MRTIPKPDLKPRTPSFRHVEALLPDMYGGPVVGHVAPYSGNAAAIWADCHSSFDGCPVWEVFYSFRERMHEMNPFQAILLEREGTYTIYETGF